MILKKEIKFAENDIPGALTLDVMGEAENFNRWMYQTIKPYCQGKILEIGSGTGNISKHFLNDQFDIFLTDIRRRYCQQLAQTYKHHPHFRGVETLNLTDPQFDQKYTSHLGQYDTVFALNVIEHIQDDHLAIKNCYKLLRTGGQLIVLVPAFQALYNQFDTELGHYRRYRSPEMSAVFSKCGFQIRHQQYFNFIGIFGWFVSGKLLKNRTIPAGQMNLFNFLVPLVKLVDQLLLFKIGLSSITLGVK